MKDILLRLAVFYLVTINAKENSNAEPQTYNNAGQVPQWSDIGGARNDGQNSYKQGAGNNKRNDLPNQVSQNPTQNNANGLGRPPTAASRHLQVAAESEGRMTTTFMAEIGKETAGFNFIINPFGIWTITALIYGVAGGHTKNELAQILSGNNSTLLEKAYSEAFNVIQKSTNDVESKTVNFVARPEKKKFKPEFSKRLQQVFLAEDIAVRSFKDPDAAWRINQWAAKATRDRITNITNSEDLQNMTLVLGTAAFFKGRWKYPFNISETFTDDFKDESDSIIGSIRMMRSREMYRNGYSNELECQVIELPYGDGEISMVVFLPRRKVSQQSVLEQMRGKTLAELLRFEMSEEEVDLSFPSFTSSNNLPLNKIYSNLHAESMLNPGADLRGLSDQDYISRISHSAEIETSEEGTTASAVTSAQVSYKVSSASFHANRPFIYFINHVPTRLVLFSGRFMDPVDKFINKKS